MHSTQTTGKASLPRLGFRAVYPFCPAERLLLAMVLTLAFASFLLATGMQRIVDWAGFSLGILAAFGMIAVGAYARSARKAARLGSAAIGVGIFMGFTAFASIFIFSLFPLTNPLIDRQLIAWDASLGYDWAGFVAGLTHWPVLGTALGYLYHSSLPQMVLVIVVLAATGRNLQLHRFLLVGMISLIAAVGIWWLFPSIGPSAYAAVPTEIAAKIGLVVTPAVGEHLMMLVETGPKVVGPEAVMGVVAFPSYHMIMALLVAWYARRTIIFLPVLVASIGMVPATLSHGGHHLVDLIAAVVVFGLSVSLSNRLLPDRS